MSRSFGDPRSSRWYYHLLTPDFQVFELYRDSAAGDGWVLDKVHD
jgi:hypothetical protein